MVKLVSKQISKQAGSKTVDEVEFTYAAYDITSACVSSDGLSPEPSEKPMKVESLRILNSKQFLV